MVYPIVREKYPRTNHGIRQTAVWLVRPTPKTMKSSVNPANRAQIERSWSVCEFNNRVRLWSCTQMQRVNCRRYGGNGIDGFPQATSGACEKRMQG